MTAPAYRADGVRTVGVVGAGLIGSMWAACFLWRGLDVRLFDPLAHSRAQAPAVIAAALADLAAIEVRACGRLSVHETLAEALDGADYVQENAPERIAVKRAVLAEIDALVPPDVVIGSSTSSLRATDMQQGCAGAHRILVAHPFNPPHLVPLVELVRGEQTHVEAQDAAHAFFARIGRAPIRVTREARGHVANRMSAALWREAVHIVAEGIASVEDVDRAICYGPGLRWAVHGPHMLYHLGGGAGGIRAYLEHLGPAQEARWAELGAPRLDAETCEKLVAGVEAEAAGRSIPELAAARDARLIALLQALGDRS